MLDVMYDIPSREDIAEVTVNRAVVDGKRPRSFAASRTRTRVAAGWTFLAPVWWQPFVAFSI